MAWPTVTWLQQTPAPQEYHRPAVKQQEERSFNHVEKFKCWTNNQTILIYRLLNWNSPQPHPHSGIPWHSLTHTEWKTQLRSQRKSGTLKHHTCCEWLKVQNFISHKTIRYVGNIIKSCFSTKSSSFLFHFKRELKVWTQNTIAAVNTNGKRCLSSAWSEQVVQNRFLSFLVAK